jgi:hypothetical protein
VWKHCDPIWAGCLCDVWNPSALTSEGRQIIAGGVHTSVVEINNTQAAEDIQHDPHLVLICIKTRSLILSKQSIRIWVMHANSAYHLAPGSVNVGLLDKSSFWSLLHMGEQRGSAKKTPARIMHGCAVLTQLCGTGVRFHFI